MNKQNTYNLNNIPGFNDLIKTGTIVSEYEKYYTLHQYCTKSNEKYTIVRYNKELLSSDLINTYGFLRSLILSNGRVLCFAPQKSLSAEKFMLKYPTKNEKIVAQEFIEGTMINVFFDALNNHWQIATRNTVGAEVSFYKNTSTNANINTNANANANMTFNQMFMQACVYSNFNIECLNQKYCYSFVLQHPSNRIVIPFKNPEIYLVGVYEIRQTDESIVVVEDDLLEIKKSGFFSLTGIKFPENYDFSTYAELIEKYASGNTPYTVMGVVVKNTETGERTKFRNPIYEEIRHLKGNQPKLQYQYLCLRQSGKLSEYLKYYPESKREMSNFREQVHMFTDNLYKNYISCYIKKTQPLKLYPSQYRTHMFKLHEHYLNNLRAKNLYINNTEVINYVNKLHPSLLMYCLNYNTRKRAIDALAVDANI